MRFPHDAYAKMVAQEKTSVSSRQVANSDAVEKKTVVSESAIEDDVITEEKISEEVEDEILTD